MGGEARTQRRRAEAVGGLTAALSRETTLHIKRITSRACRRRNTGETAAVTAIRVYGLPRVVAAVVVCAAGWSSWLLVGCFQCVAASRLLRCVCQLNAAVQSATAVERLNEIANDHTASTNRRVRITT